MTVADQIAGLSVKGVVALRTWCIGHRKASDAAVAVQAAALVETDRPGRLPGMDRPPLRVPKPCSPAS